MSATDVSICSNALLMLGARPITDLAEDDDRARIANGLYAFVRDSVLRSFPWNCCIARVVLSPDVAAPSFDWSYQFTLPPDFVKALAVGEDGAEIEFRLEGRKILCDSNPCKLRYITNNTNPATWDAGLVAVVTSAMAAAMAYPITQSASLAQVMEQKAQMVARQARSVDGQDDTGETIGDFHLLRSRFGSMDPLSQ